MNVIQSLDELELQIAMRRHAERDRVLNEIASAGYVLSDEHLEFLQELPDHRFHAWLLTVPEPERPRIQQELSDHATAKERAEGSLHEFVRQAWRIVEPKHNFINNWHIDAICASLERLSHESFHEEYKDVESGETKTRAVRNILINVPAGTSKTLIVSILWPCWAWIHQPWSRWTFASYAQELSTENSEKRRTIIQSEWPPALFWVESERPAAAMCKRRRESAAAVDRPAPAAGTTRRHRGDRVASRLVVTRSAATGNVGRAAEAAVRAAGRRSSFVIE